MHRQLTWVIVILLAPTAMAGSQDDPEIRDEAGDVRWAPAADDVTDFPTGHDDVFDILSTWFHNETRETISVTMRVADLTAVDDFGMTPSAFARWGTRFEVSNYEEDSRDNWWNYTWIAGIDFNNGPPGWRGSLYTPDRGGERGDTIDLEFDVDRDAGTLTVIIPRNDLGFPAAGDRLLETRSLHDGRIGQADFQDQSQGTVYPSRDYVFSMDTASAAGALPGNASEEPAAAGTPSPGNGTTDAGGDADGRQVPAPAIGLVMAALLLARRRR